VKKVLSLGHTPFQAPAWSPDRSHLAYVSAVKQNSGLFVSDPEGKDPRSLVELPDGQVSFVWAPDSHHIAYSTAPMPGAMIFDGINLLDTTTAKAKKLVREPVAAFYFSPDSKYLAYVVVPEGKAYYQWKLANLSTGKNLSMFNFITTRDESLSYRFFDQLALSHAIWSPDSKALVFAGVPVTGEAPRASVGPSPPPYVFIVPIDHPHPLPVAEGTLAFWSPSPAK